MTAHDMTFETRVADALRERFPHAAFEALPFSIQGMCDGTAFAFRIDPIMYSMPPAHVVDAIVKSLVPAP